MLAQQICKKKKEICQICWYGQVMNAFPGSKKDATECTEKL